MKDNDKVKCPNECFNGNIIYYPNKYKALWKWKKCPYCKQGFVDKKDFEKIKKML